MSGSMVRSHVSSATQKSLPQESATGSAPFPASVEGERADEQGRGNLSPDPTKNVSAMFSMRCELEPNKSDMSHELHLATID